jgi:hypothetical protein
MIEDKIQVSLLHNESNMHIHRLATRCRNNDFVFHLGMVQV